ncbi:MAG: hypothetical protein HXX16_06005 [Bacteroidales bacterium]|nr:hypothetical protein [Bacteroidales bacterium]
MKFEEGIWYSFSISGIVDIPDKGEHFILLHDSGRKMLLRTDYYVKYNYALGQIIECRVDKVNCTGQVFLEPKHPHYNDGQVYSFDIIRIFLDEESLYNAKVKDVFSNEIDVYLYQTDGLQTKKNIMLQVVQVKKGLPILCDIQKGKSEIIEFDYGKEIKLKVKSVKKYNSEDFYILYDGDTIKTKIKVKYYKNYGFDIGDEVICEIIGIESNNYFIVVEPKNPWYKIGNVYTFTKIGIEKYAGLEEDKAKVMIVLDNNGNKCGVPINKTIATSLQERDKIECRVIGFRKGRPQLEIDQNP